MGGSVVYYDRMCFDNKIVLQKNEEEYYFTNRVAA